MPNVSQFFPKDTLKRFLPQQSFPICQKKQREKLEGQLDRSAETSPQARLVRDLWKQGATIHKAEDTRLHVQSVYTIAALVRVFDSIRSVTEADQDLPSVEEVVDDLQTTRGKIIENSHQRNMFAAGEINRNLRDGRLGLLIFGSEHIQGILGLLEPDIEHEILDSEIQREIYTPLRRELHQEAYTHGKERI